MFIDFKKEQDLIEYHSTVEFEALIIYKSIDFDCQTWLDSSITFLMSPSHPNIKNCSWLITSNYGSYINLDFIFFEVNSMKVSRA